MPLRLSQIFFFHLSGLQKVFAALTHFQTAQLALVCLILLDLSREVATSAYIQHSATLLQATAKTTEYRLEALTFLAFDFNICHRLFCPLLSGMGGG